MPLPQEVIAEAQERNERVKARIANLEDVIADLRASGIDASKREEEVRVLREELRKWETFYGLQSKRTPATE